MAIDEDNDDGLGGRSRDRREFTAANSRWAGPLVALEPLALAAAPLPDAVRAEAELARRLAAAENWLARDRSMRRIDKLVRELEEDEIAAIDAFLAAPGQAAAARDAEIEAWRSRLVAEGEPALEALIRSAPDVDRQRMRQLVRNARRPDAGDRARRLLVEALAQAVPSAVTRPRS